MFRKIPSNEYSLILTCNLVNIRYSIENSSKLLITKEESKMYKYK